MPVFELQSAILRLACDPGAFSAFEKSPADGAAALGLEANDAAALATLDLRGFRIFREVIEGTRARRFETLLPRLAATGRWQSLLGSFHAKVAVPTSRNDADLTQFVAHVLAEEGTSDAGRAIRLDALALDLARGAAHLPSAEWLRVSDHARQLAAFPVLGVRSPCGEVEIYELDDATIEALRSLREAGALRETETP